MHAALSIAAVAGSWRHEGGGAFHSNGGIYHWDKTLLEGLDHLDPDVRMLDQSRIGAILTGDTGHQRRATGYRALYSEHQSHVGSAGSQPGA